MVQAPAGMEIIGAMRTDTGLVRALNEELGGLGDAAR